MKASGGSRTAAVLGPLALLAGCYQTTNVAKLTPLHTAYPVSASPQYVDQSGQIVTQKDYEVVHPFSFSRIVQAPLHKKTVTALAFEPDLDRIMRITQGDAITNMSVEAANYEAGSHSSSAGWKIAGWAFGITGASLLVAGAVDEDELQTGLIVSGIVCTGIGALSYLLGRAQQEPASWQLEVSGKVVKRTGPAVQATMPVDNALD